MNQTQSDELVEIIRAFTPIAKAVTKLEETVLAGWPHNNFANLPSVGEAYDISSTFHELMLTGRFEEDDQITAWRLAGSIIARIKRDHAVGSL